MTVPAWRVRGVGRGQRRVQGCVIWVCDVCCARSCMGARGGGGAGKRDTAPCNGAPAQCTSSGNLSPVT
jgi:hypothetical protein